MTAPLEFRYRRLLAFYPAGHRRDYEEEMVGVLMAGAEPGQRRPAVGEALDLLRSGLTARLGRGAAELRTTVWREAAALAALAGVVILAAVPVRRLILGLQYARGSGDPMRAFGVDGGLLADVAARSVAWLAVLVAVLLAARRTAAVLGAVALVVEIAAIVAWRQEFRILEMSWVPVLSVLTLGLLVRARHARPVAALRAGPAGRRRALVLLVPVLAVPVAQQVLDRAIGLPSPSSVTPGILLADLVIMAGLPVAAWAVAVLALRRRERDAVPSAPVLPHGDAG